VGCQFYVEDGEAVDSLDFSDAFAQQSPGGGAVDLAGGGSGAGAGAGLRVRLKLVVVPRWGSAGRIKLTHAHNYSLSNP
jgi:hypothetical protein